MKKFVLTLLVALVAIASFAYDVEVDGIYYNLNNEEKTAEVTNETGSWNAKSYSGSVVIPEQITVGGVAYSVTSIGDLAFRYCSGLTSVTIPNSVTSIGGYAFEGCSGLTSVEIPNSVTSIGSYAFEYCSGLTSLIIPNSVTSIGWGAFEYCSGLTSFVVDSDNQNYCSEDNVLFNKDKTELLFCIMTKTGNYNIPNSVTSIGWLAFDGCSGLTSVTIPNSVTSIGSHAFGGCSDLFDVYCYAEKVPETDTYAFSGVKIEGAVLHVPTVALKKYRKAEPWKYFHNIVPLTD